MIVKNKRIPITSAIIFFIVIIFSRCLNQEKPVVITDSKGEQFAGSASCKSCHKDIYNSFVHTAHYQDSRPASKETIKGSFSPDENYYTYNYNVNRAVAMEESDSGFYQVAYINKKRGEAHRFDIVIGSGRKGQSFLSWKGNHLIQLPISYFTTENTWVNSSGFSAATIDFNRIIYARCLECHATYVKQDLHKPYTVTQPLQFKRDQIIYGIDCERCHGAAEKHVVFHLQHPGEKQAKFIVRLSSLSKQQKLDACALCHSGTRESLQPAFSFSTGDTLSRYYKPAADLNLADIDVHGNQYGLLKASKCFIISRQLDCSSCHNTHKEEKNNTIIFSQRCMSCHSTANHNFCTMAPKLGKSIENNCIDCHMPAQASKTLTFGNPKLEASVPALVRTHFISIYPQATQKFMLTYKAKR